MQKFVPEVEQITFSGQLSVEVGQTVLYVTERCVFRCGPNALELTEVAPGIDIERDIPKQMGFLPIIEKVKAMDGRLFRPELMRLRSEFLEASLVDRVSFDAEKISLP